MKRPNNPESQNARNPRRTPGFLATKNLATQFAIGDINDVDFGNFEGGVGVSAGESSKINILSPGIFGNGSRFGSASDLSQVTIGGGVKIADGLKLDVAFLSSAWNSIVSFYPSSMDGGTSFSGASYQCVDSTIKKNVTLPGGDIAYFESDDCTIRGAVSTKASNRFDQLYFEITVLRTTLTDLNIRLADLGAKFDAISPEPGAIRAEIDDVEHRMRLELRRDRIVYGTITALIVLALAALRFNRRPARFRPIILRTHSR
jgi:hypothetical protein